MGLLPVVVCYNARQDNKIEYGIVNTILHNTIHITQNNIQNSRQPSISKLTKTIQNTYTIKTQK